jgi:hypothetical protein
MDSLFTVTDENELLALHKALLEAKFNESADDPVIQGSPYVAHMANRVADKLQELNPSYTEWRVAENHKRYISVVKSSINQCAIWPDWNINQRTEYVSILLSPLTASSELVDELVGIEHA